MSMTPEVGPPFPRRSGLATVAGKDLLVEFLRSDLDTSKADAEQIAQSVARAIATLAERHGSVRFPGLGTFSVLETSGRDGRNPRTGEVVPIAAGRRVTFRAAAPLKTRLNT